MARLQAKYDHIRVTLGDQTLQTAEGNLTLTRRPNVGRRYVEVRFHEKKKILLSQRIIFSVILDKRRNSKYNDKKIRDSVLESCVLLIGFVFYLEGLYFVLIRYKLSVTK